MGKLVGLLKESKDPLEIFDSILKNEIINNQDLSSIALIRSKIYDIDFNECVLDAAMLFDNLFCNVKFNNCRFNKAELKESQFENCQFSNCEIWKSEFYDSSFSRSSLFIDSSIKSSSFALCDLRNISFINTDIEGCFFYDSKMYKTSFDKLKLRENLDFDYLFQNADVSELGDSSIIKSGRETLSYFRMIE